MKSLGTTLSHRHLTVPTLNSAFFYGLWETLGRVKTKRHQVILPQVTARPRQFRTFLEFISAGTINVPFAPFWLQLVGGGGMQLRNSSFR